MLTVGPSATAMSAMTATHAPPSARAGAAPQLTVRVDPTLAEAAVRIALDGPSVPEELATLHRQRIDGCYEIPDPAARERAFGALALAEFAELELAVPLIRAVAERPEIGATLRLLLVGEADRRDEGVTCERGGEHLGVRVDARRLADPDGLLGWARHALGHAADTLDPAFEFAPGWEEGPDGRVAATVAARLHRLWDVAVDGRLAAAGLLDGAATRRVHRARLAADLPGVPGPAVDAVVDRLWQGERPSFAELLAWSRRPADLVEVAAPGTPRPRPDRCPLCRFPGDDVVPPGPDVAAAVARDYPHWRVSDGLCGRCADRYRFLGFLGGAR